MSLREQMSLQRAPVFPSRADQNGANGSMVREAYQKLRREIHTAVLERVELERLSLSLIHI